MIVVNYIAFLFINLYSLYLLNKPFVLIKHPWEKSEMLEISGLQAFFLLVFCTGLFALSGEAGSFDLMAIRLLFIEIFCLIGLFLQAGKLQTNIVVVFYALYLGWILFGLSYSRYPDYGMRVFLKYVYPLLVLLVASKAGSSEEYFIKVMLLTRKVGAIIILSLVTFGFLSFIFSGFVWYGTALATHAIFLMVLSLALFHLRQNKWDLLYAIVFTLPAIIWVFRTDLVGIAVAAIVYSFIRYKVRSLPYILGLLVLFLVVVMFNSGVRKKMFRANVDTDKLMEEEGQGIKKDDIDSNGRFAMWDWSMNMFYKPHPLIGSGSGTLQSVFYKLKKEKNTAGIVHNDYVQILCDNGQIGLILYLLTYLGMLVHVFLVYNNKSNTEIIRLAAIVAGASAWGMAATSITDNTVNYSMATLSYPFGMYGFLLGLLSYQKYVRTVGEAPNEPTQATGPDDLSPL